MTSKEELGGLIRDVLPPPEAGTIWNVEIVDEVQEAGAERNPRPVVRVHRLWREAVYDAGLRRVTRHYPLGLDRVPDQEVPLSFLLRNVRAWHGITLERVYSRGHFTGQLTVGEAYIAQTEDGLGVAADEELASAARTALAMRRSQLRRLSSAKVEEADLRHRLRDLLHNRHRGRSTHDIMHPVSLEPFRRHLPSNAIHRLELQGLGSDVVPLRVLELECAEAVLHTPAAGIPAIIYELDIATAAARSNSGGWSETAVQSDETLADLDLEALASLA